MSYDTKIFLYIKISLTTSTNQVVLCLSLVVHSGRLGHHSAVEPLHFRHSPVLVLEHFPDAVLITQHPASPVADPVPGEPEIPAGVRRIRRGAGLSETDLHGEHGRTRRRVSRKSCTRLGPPISLYG